MAAPAHRVDTEIDDLTARFGQPAIVSETLRIKSMFGAIDERPARVAEVVPVIQRENGHVLAMIKDGYPAEAYRLPSGGIHKGEAILDALLRESYEETGLLMFSASWPSCAIRSFCRQGAPAASRLICFLFTARAIFTP